MHKKRAGQRLVGKHQMGLGLVSSGSQHTPPPLPLLLLEVRNED